ncbi:hypothetical protein GALL_486990 [mine drainage metagenome]|uniref:Uncharacterized protein n=1 Tax=mine drainage metagenome TaxID=410659 RepID=A0A1J5PFY4_9ZZZZ
MVPAGEFGHFSEVPGPGQFFQHLDGCHNVVIDGVAPGGGQRAFADAQVFRLVYRQEDRLQTLRIAPPVLAANAPHPLHIGIAHELAAAIGAAQEVAVGFNIFTAGLQGLKDRAFSTGIHARPQRQLLTQGINFSVTLEHFKAGLDQTDAVVQGLQLGRFVHHMHRGGDLAAVVQQTGNFEFIAVQVGHDETRQWTFLRL